MNYTTPYTFGGFLTGLIYSRYKWKEDNPYGDQFESITRPIYATYYGAIGTAIGLSTGILSKALTKK